MRFARLVEDEGLVWLEEPCRWDNDRRFLRDVRAARAGAGVRGTERYSAAGCLELMAGGSIDVCNFDSSWSGGPTEWRRVAAAAHTLGVAMAHHEEPQVASHLLASIPHGTYVECFHPDRDPIWWNLVANRPRARGRHRSSCPTRRGSAGSSISSTWRRTLLCDVPGTATRMRSTIARRRARSRVRRRAAPAALPSRSSNGVVRMPFTSGESATENSDQVGRSRIGDEMERRRHEHAGREAVRHDLDRPLARELRDLSGDGEAAAARDIGLEHVDVAALDEGAERRGCRSPPRRLRSGRTPRRRAAGSRRDRRAASASSNQ